MGKVFNTYLFNGSVGLELALPATDYTLLDAQERLGLAPGKIPCLDVSYREDLDFMINRMQKTPDLYQLNRLARQLDELDDNGLAAFEGMVGMRIQKKELPISVTDLIDMAYNTEHCHVVPDAATDYELGRFYAENDFYKETEGLTDAAFALLDFGRMGRESREAKGGVFTSYGYVVQESPPEPVADKMDFTPKKPDHTFLVERKCPGDPDAVKQIDFPNLESAIETASQVGGTFIVRECPIPRLEGVLVPAEALLDLDVLSRRVRDFDDAGVLPRFKALLQAKGCDDVEAALALSRTVDEYTLSRDLRTPEDVALDEINGSVDSRTSKLLIKHLNLYAYGRDLIKEEHSVLTDYGLLDRRDGQPIQSVDEQPGQEQGGMTFG